MSSLSGLKTIISDTLRSLIYIIHNSFVKYIDCAFCLLESVFSAVHIQVKH